ncbi:response regulator transcription factor [Glycomyces albidus]|jgi:two-component system OmpR family response regulator|uniref:Response regulator n=1 Tax=Glycomyces albidus TaxID=2656774 RepID=A0A6L5GCG2_9ACTN|nr:response regulator transcription factor [Glycomyces albidus]MQM27271.1 response regulator [Glycomyces albidus]
MAARAKVLVVDDEVYLAELVATALRFEGFATAVAHSGPVAWRSLRDDRPDLLVLDVMLGETSGFDLCRQMRDAGIDAPVVFLTARDAPGDRISGFVAGGDDYVTKPFSIEELVLRVLAVTRRLKGPGRPHVLRVADLVLDEAAHEVRRAGRRIQLTPTEFALLRLLMAHPGQVLTKAQILDRVWQYDFGGNASVVQTYVSYLRAKVDRVPDGPDPVPLIHTVNRVGYMMRAEPR